MGGAAIGLGGGVLCGSAPADVIGVAFGAGGVCPFEGFVDGNWGLGEVLVRGMNVCIADCQYGLIAVACYFESACADYVTDLAQ